MFAFQSVVVCSMFRFGVGSLSWTSAERICCVWGCGVATAQFVSSAKLRLLVVGDLKTMVAGDGGCDAVWCCVEDEMQAIAWRGTLGQTRVWCSSWPCEAECDWRRVR